MKITYYLNFVEEKRVSMNEYGYQLLKLGKNAQKCFKSNFDLASKENSLATYLKNEVNKKNE